MRVWPDKSKSRDAAAQAWRRGFTLVEMVTTIVIGTIICGSAGMLMLNATKQRSQSAARVELVDVAGRAVEQTLRYLREISQDAGLTGKAQISTAEATQVRFGNNGFRLNGTAMEMTLNNGTNWYPMARDVSALTFSYFKGDMTALSSLPLSATDREAVRVIRIKLTLTRSSETTSVQSSIYLRNFMNEASS